MTLLNNTQGSGAIKHITGMGSLAVIDDNTDSMHTGIIQYLNAAAAGNHVVDGMKVSSPQTVNNDANGDSRTQFTVGAGRYFKNHVLQPFSEASITLTDSFDPAAFTYYIFLVVNSSGSLALRGNASDGASETDVGNLSDGDIPIALIEINKSSAANDTDRKIQHFGATAKGRGFSVMGSTGAEKLRLNTDGTIEKIGGGTLTLPDATDTLVGRNTTDTLTNKTLTTPIIATIKADSDSSHAVPNVASDTFALLAAAQTLTNKTLTSPTITGTGAIAGTFTGNLTGNVTGDVTGNADTATTTTGNAATATTATTATNVTVSANDATDETVFPLFVDAQTGSRPVETDVGLKYNPNTGKLISTTFEGNLTGNVTGNVDGNAATVSSIQGRSSDELIQGNTNLFASTANVKTALNANLTALTIGDSSDTITIPGNLVVTGTTTTNQIDVSTTNNGIRFESNASGPNTDAETLLIGPLGLTGDVTITLPNTDGTLALTSSNITGNAATATKLQTTRAFSLTGDVTASGVNFDGSGPIALNTTISPDSVQDIVGGQFVTNGSHTNITAAYDGSGDGAIDLSITDATIRGKISVSGTQTGDGSLAYDSQTGVITYTGPSASETRAHFSGGTGVTISSGVVSIPQAVATNSDVQFNSISLGGDSSHFLKADGSADTNTYLTAHPNISGASSVNQSTAVFISGLTIDNDGHVTGTQTASAIVGISGAGNYITASNDNGTVTVDIDLGQLSDMTDNVNRTQDELVILDQGSQKRKLISEIPISSFNNDGSALSPSNFDSITSLDSGDTIVVTDSSASHAGKKISQTNFAGSFSLSQFTNDLDIFKTISVSGQTDIVADAGTDTLTFVGAGGTTITTSSTNDTITFTSTHDNISAASSSDNSGRTYIQDLTLDSNGHVTGIATATETVTNSFRTVSVDTNGDGSANETLGASETLTLKKGSNITLAELDGVVTITNAAPHIATNLGSSTATGQITITSSTGNNVVIGEATTSIAGLMSTDHHDKLDGIEASATADQTDSEIETAYNNQVAAVSSQERTDGTVTTVRRFTPNDIKSMIDTHQTDTVFSHPTHDGDDINIDTGPLTGATVISDLDFNVTTDTLGHVTDANASVSTRTLTLANLGFTGDSDATDDQTAVEIIALLNSDLGGDFTIGNQSNDTATFTGHVSVGGNLTVTGTVTTENVETVSTSNGVVFEGSGNADTEITLKGGTVSGADKTILLPNADGTVLLTDGSGASLTALNASEITSGTISADRIPTLSASKIIQISNLTTAEGAQLENINSTTISAAQWGYLGAATGAITNTDTTYSISAVDGGNTDEEIIRLTDSDGNDDDVVLEAGTGLSIARDNDKITFTNTVTNTNQLTTFNVKGDDPSDTTTISHSDTLIIRGDGSNISANVVANGDRVNISLDDTAVTAGSYTAADITVDAKGRITAASNGSVGVSFNGSTANGLLTFGGSSTADVESNLTFSEVGTASILDIGGTVSKLNLSGSGGAVVATTGDNNLTINTGSGQVRVTNDLLVDIGTYANEATFFVDASTDRVGIGTTIPQADLHIMARNTGDAVMILEADTDNNAGTDQPYIIFEQRGSIQSSMVGANTSSNTDKNTLMLANSANVHSGIVFKTGTTNGFDNAVERMRILPAGGIKFNDAYTFPTSDGSANQVLTTDGNGTLTFEDLSTLGGGGGGDITSVQDGNGLTGGADSGPVTLTVGAGTGITVNTNDVAVTAAQTGITSILNSSLKLGYGASDAYIDFGTDNQIDFAIDNTDQLILSDGVFRPAASNDIALGQDAKRWSSVSTVGLSIGATNSSAATMDTIQVSTASFSDDDTSLMTSAAILDKINSRISASSLSALLVRGDTDQQSITSGETLDIAGGTGITTNATTTNQLTVDLDATHTGITSILNSSLVVGRDADNQIQFSTENEIHFKTNGETPVIKMKASGEIEATSLDISGDVDVDGTLEADAITLGGTAVAVSGGAFHDGFSDFVANEHIDHSGVSILGGNGLTGGGDITSSRTLAVGAGTGINVSVNAISVDVAEALNVDLGGDIVFGTQTDDNVKYTGSISVGDVDQAGSALITADGFATMNGLFLGYGSGPGYIKTYNSSDNLELYAHSGSAHVKMLDLDAVNNKVIVGSDLEVGVTGTAGKIYLSVDDATSFLGWNSTGTDITLAASDDLTLHADDDIFFQAGGNTKAVLLNTGELGIGTTSPDTILHVSSDTHPSIRITGTDNAGADPAIEMLGQGNSFAEGLQMWYDNGAGIAHIAALYDNGVGDLQFHTRTGADRSTSNVRMTIEADGNVGIGTTDPGHKLEVNGSFAATTKSFDIEHPTKEGMRLHHGSLEGPEHGVYIRGRLEGNEIDLPDYWLGLVDEDTITVQLTPNKGFQQIYVEDISDNKVYVGTQGDKPIDCFYFIQAERKDVDKMEVEY